nr:YraN family protein [Adlercreutzia sp. ZJ154]
MASASCCWVIPAVFRALRIRSPVPKIASSRLAFLPVPIIAHCSRFRASTPTDGEQIDIVAENGDALVFIDVKARRDVGKGFPSESMTKRTRERREKAAIQWLRSEGMGYRDRPVRFDSVSLLMLATDRALIRHTINAMGCDSCAPAGCEPEPAPEPELACATA